MGSGDDSVPNSADKSSVLGRFQRLDLLDSAYDIARDHLGNATKNPGTTAAVTPGFNTWTTANTDRPSFLVVETYVETDGTTAGQIDIDVDESGGTTADYSLTNIAPAAVGGSETDSHYVYLPAGAQYQINNVTDPNLANAINVVRQLDC